MVDAINAKDREPARNEDASRSIRPVIEHALTDYYDGNVDLARALIDQLLNENQSQ
jgi:hypothetical protein